MEALQAFKQIAPYLGHGVVLIGFVLLPFLFDDIKSQTEKVESFFKWLAEVWRGRKWLAMLSLLAVVLAFIFNPVTFPEILSSVTPELTLPRWYAFAFWGVIVLLFVVAMVVAVRAKPRESETQAPDLAKRSSIKGLRPYAFQDAELFAQLQREQDLRKCLDTITDRDFRFGIVFGESG